MGMENFFKGLKVFQDGMQQMATAGAIKDAQKDLETAQLTFAEAEGMTPEQVGVENKHLDEARNRISQDLMGRLAGIGATGTQINAASAFGLTRQQDLARQDKFKVADVKAQAKASAPKFTPKQEFDVRRDQQKAVRQLSEDFTSQTRDLRAGIASGQKAAKAIELGVKNAAAAGSVKTMLAKALQPGNLTDREQAVFEGSPELLNQGKRLYRKLAKGQGFTPEDQSILRQYNNALLDVNVDEFNKQKSNYIGSQAESLGQLGLGEEALSKSLGRFEFKSSRQQAEEQYVDGLIKSGKLKPERRDVFLQRYRLNQEAKKQ